MQWRIIEANLTYFWHPHLPPGKVEALYLFTSGALDHIVTPLLYIENYISDDRNIGLGYKFVMILKKL